MAGREQKWAGTLLYLVLYAYLVIPNRFATVFFQQRGVSPADVGSLMAGFSISRWIGTVLLGGLADKTGVAPRTIIWILLPASCGAFCAMYWESTLLQYWVTFCSFSFLFGPVQPLTDSAVIGAFGKEKWGGLRAYGAAAWGLVGAAIGELINRLGLETMFVAASVSTVLAMLAFSFIDLTPPEDAHAAPLLDACTADEDGEQWEKAEGGTTQEKKEAGNARTEGQDEGLPSFGVVLGIPVRSLDLFVLHCTALSFGFIMAPVQSLLLVFILDHLKGSARLCGLSILVTGTVLYCSTLV
jgi:MFS family permease